jgi:hypothetical protein
MKQIKNVLISHSYIIFNPEKRHFIKKYDFIANGGA